MNIELKDVKYSYPLQEDYAISEVNFNIVKGGFYGVVGANGAGKTTLCNIVRGLIPHFFKGDLHGEVLIDGKDVREWDDSDLSVRIGYIFQNPFTQLSRVKNTVFEEIAFGLENLGWGRERIIQRVVDVLELFKLEALANRDPRALSGGQSQRVAFASIIAMDSEALVIDEPTSQLDPVATEEIFEIIHQLRKLGKTILLVEQDVDVLAELADEVLVLDSGEIIAQGTPRNVFNNLGALQSRTNVPQVSKLGHTLRAEGFPVNNNWVTEDEVLGTFQDWGLSW